MIIQPSGTVGSHDPGADQECGWYQHEVQSLICKQYRRGKETCSKHHKADVADNIPIHFYQ